MSDVNLPALAEPDKNNALKTPMQEIDQAYKACKFGLFHIRLLAISFVGYISGVLVSATTSYLLPSAECDLGMTLVQKGLLNAIPYLGMLLSTVIAGFLTDTFGRKFFLMLGFGGMFLFMFIAGSSQTYEVLVTAKLLEGILFATSFSAAITLTSEFCHKEIRDRVMLCMSSFSALAQVIVPAMSWAILTQDWKITVFNGWLVLNTWNFYLYLMSFWALSACLLYTFFLPESPKYLVTQKKYDEARDILIQMYRINTRKPAETYPYIDIWKDKAKRQLPEVEEEKPKSIRHQIVVGLHNIKPMFRRPLVIYLTLISVSSFLIMALTLAISVMMMSGRIGTLVGNIGFPILLDMGCSIPFFTMSGMVFCVTVMALLLPKKN